MIVIIRRKLRMALLAAAGLLALLALWFVLSGAPPRSDSFAGGTLHAARTHEEGAVRADAQSDEPGERFQRPSKQAALPNPYTANALMQPAALPSFAQPEAVIYAYFALLEEASNMLGYSGGCGTIGNAALPYPYAYSLLTPEAQARLSPEAFQDSFRGIGHTTLLQLYPLPNPEGTPPETEYYLVELEVITGKSEKEAPGSPQEQISYFAYYYGIVTVQKAEGGWKIQRIDYLPENYLCAPYHSWFYEATLVVPIVYQENIKLVDSVNDSLKKDHLLFLYASGKGQEYRFDFVRLTNGYDILIGENILQNGEWQPVALLPEEWAYMKLTPKTIGGFDTNPA